MYTLSYTIAMINLQWHTMRNRTSSSPYLNWEELRTIPGGGDY